MKEGPYPNRLAEVMRARGLTDPELARELGISKQQIFNLRRGHRKLTVEWAKRLAPPLGMSWQELITGAPSASFDQARADLLAAYDAMDDEQRRALLAMAQIVVRPQPTEEATSSPLPKLRAAGCIVPVTRVGRAGKT